MTTALNPIMNRASLRCPARSASTRRRIAARSRIVPPARRAARWCATNATSPATAPTRRDRRTGRPPRRRTGGWRSSGSGETAASPAARPPGGSVGARPHRRAIVPTIPCSAVSRSRNCSHHDAKASIRSCSTFMLVRRRAQSPGRDESAEAPANAATTHPVNAGEHRCPATPPTAGRARPAQSVGDDDTAAGGRRPRRTSNETPNPTSPPRQGDKHRHQRSSPLLRRRRHPAAKAPVPARAGQSLATQRRQGVARDEVAGCRRGPTARSS